MKSKTYPKRFITALTFVSALFLFVLAVSLPAISFNLILAEQTELYLANQHISSLHDLWSMYSHPQILNLFYIPFFRPSGHFLLYQILAPILGWHNHQGFIVVSLFFLALTGYMMCRVYNLLFPDYKIGGLIAFSIYLMHPALSLSRLTVFHFEFAYIFFSLVGLYYFIRFCQENTRTFTAITATQFLSIRHLIFALFFFIMAVTFKEPAIMLGPVFIIYLLSQFSVSLFKQRLALTLMALIFTLTLTLGIYLTLAWPSTYHPISLNESNYRFLYATLEMLKDIFGLPIPSYDIKRHNWRDIAFPLSTHFIMIVLVGLTLLRTYSLYKKTNPEQQHKTKKSFSFLYCAALLFLLLPIAWGIGNPWHVSLTLVCLSLIMGYSVEYYLVALTSRWALLGGGMIAITIGLTTLLVNQANIQLYQQQYGFYITLTQNAIYHPPAIQTQLNAHSMIVIEDQNGEDGYLLGSLFPINWLLDIGKYNYNALEKTQDRSFFKFDSVSGGTFFRFAYLIPTLEEQIYPFQIEKMQTVPTIVIYTWLQHYNNIFCIGFDEKAEWHDRTAAFKTHLLQEKKRRQLTVNSYHILSGTALLGKPLGAIDLPFPEHELCALTCDKMSTCNGFTYIELKTNPTPIRKCAFYQTAQKSNSTLPCKECTGFIKQ